MKNPFNRKEQEFPEVSISEMDDIRALHLGTDVMQSAMNLKNPAQLVLSYSIAMMSWLLFSKNTRHVTHIGLGGGSIVRWIANFFPQIKNYRNLKIFRLRFFSLQKINFGEVPTL